jgi:uncharacterized protein YydD (DUF2326 family)
VIYKVSSSRASFRTAKFTRGFNLILARRAEKATDKHSRNALGKSSLVSLLHFGLGSKGAKKSFPVIEALAGWQFRIDVDVFDEAVGFSRTTDLPREYVVDTAANTDAWPVSLKTKENRSVLSASDQRTLLGRAYFGLDADIENTDRGPTFRSLFSYLVRRSDGGFLSPFKNSAQQTDWDAQVNVAYLLGLNWQDAAALQRLKEEQKHLRDLQAAAKRGSLPSYLSSEGTLNTERVRLRREIAEASDRLTNFTVRDDYRDIELEASRLTEQIHELVNANARDHRFASLYTERVDEETDSAIDGDAVRKLFDEANVVLPDAVTRRLEDVEAFHRAVITNRQDYLREEIRRLDASIDQRNRGVDELDENRARLMRVLETAGALDERAALQERVNALSAKLAEVESQLKLLTEITHAKSDWDQRKLELQTKMRRRFEELGETRDRAIDLFDQNCRALYRSPGRLIIELREKGFHFGVEIDGAGSQGIASMEIFCFDLTVMQLWAGRSAAPPALVHDSALFDGVDERQIAAALQLAADEAERLGFQYICTLNSDSLPEDLLREDSIVLGPPILELHDLDPSGSLLGERFNLYEVERDQSVQNEDDRQADPDEDGVALPPEPNEAEEISPAHSGELPEIKPATPPLPLAMA